MQCNTDKNIIRNEIKKKRSSLSGEDRALKSRAVAEAFINTEQFINADVVAVYMSAFGEVDTEHIINRCRQLGKSILVPVVDGENIYLCSLDGEMEKGAFGIWEPSHKQIVKAEMADVFAVPGLAFDRFGARVGFGKGYYDKLLCNTKAAKFGLAYDFQVFEKLPSHAHDVKMDYIISESRVIVCEE